MQHYKCPYEALVIGAYLQSGRNKVYSRHFIVGMSFFFVHMQKKHYTLIDLPVCGEQTELNQIK